jgi:hypothetical protein
LPGGLCALVPKKDVEDRETFAIWARYSGALAPAHDLWLNAAWRTFAELHFKDVIAAAQAGDVRALADGLVQLPQLLRFPQVTEALVAALNRREPAVFLLLAKIAKAEAFRPARQQELDRDRVNAVRWDAARAAIRLDRP